MKYARYIEQTILEMQNNGSDVAAFICESLLGCGGQIVLPQHYLKEAYSYIRNAGGMCIADEVQVGFGRAGTHFWGFETQGVVPDIVTMGKPRGILLSTNGPCHNVLKIKPPLVFTEENADFLVGTLDEVLGEDVARV